MRWCRCAAVCSEGVAVVLIETAADVFGQASEAIGRVVEDDDGALVVVAHGEQFGSEDNH